MKVCLINPILDYQSLLSPDSQLGLEYIAAILLNNEHEVEIIDAPIENKNHKDIFEIIIKNNYDAIGISAYYYNIHSAIRIARFIKKNTQTFVFLGGYLPTLANNIMGKIFETVDCMVIGEGERTSLELINNLKNGKWKEVKGICYHKNNDIYYTGPVELVNLDSLPFPYRRKEYIGQSVQVTASRGCYGHCSFCGIMEFYESSCGNYGEVRRRSPENLIDEIENLVLNYNVKHINFVDDNFYLGSKNEKKWIEEFCSLIKKRKLHFTFNISVRANEIIHSHQILGDLIEVGLIRVFIGVESFLDSHLKFYNKKITGAMNLEAVRLLDQYDIKYEIGYMIFNPITTIEDIIDTVKVFHDNKINYLHKHIWVPISGSVVNSIYGTAMHKFIEENDCYESNEQGYHFLNANTQKCFNILKPLNDRIKYIYAKSEFYYQAKDQGRTDLMADYKDTFFELYYMYLDLLGSIANLIKLNEDSVDKVNDILKEAYICFDKIDVHLNKIKENSYDTICIYGL